MALHVFASLLLHYSAAPFEFMRAETKPPPRQARGPESLDSARDPEHVERAGGLPAGGGAAGDQGFVISPEIPAALDTIVMFQTLCGSASEKSVKFPG